MSILQIVVIAAVCLVATAPDGVVLPATAGDWLVGAYMAVFAGALAMLGQTWAQAHLPATRTAIIMSMEPVFAAFFAVLARRTSRPRCGWWSAASMVLSAMLDRRAGPAPQDRGRGPAHRRVRSAPPAARTALLSGRFVVVHWMGGHCESLPRVGLPRVVALSRRATPAGQRRVMGAARSGARREDRLHARAQRRRPGVESRGAGRRRGQGDDERDSSRS